MQPVTLVGGSPTAPRDSPLPHAQVVQSPKFKIHKYKYTNTNSQIQIHRYKYLVSCSPNAVQDSPSLPHAQVLQSKFKIQIQKTKYTTTNKDTKYKYLVASQLLVGPITLAMIITMILAVLETKYHHSYIYLYIFLRELSWGLSWGVPSKIGKEAYYGHGSGESHLSSKRLL